MVKNRLLILTHSKFLLSRCAGLDGSVNTIFPAIEIFQ